MSRIALISVLINDNVTLQMENRPYVLLDLFLHVHSLLLK